MNPRQIRLRKFRFSCQGFLYISGIVRQFKPWYYEVKQGSFLKEDFYVKNKIM